MSRWIVLSRQAHAEARYRPRQGYRHAAEDRVAPVLLAELPRLLPYYTLAFLRQKDETFLPVALLGLAAGRNLYLHHDGRWLADYVPAVLRGYPFALAKSPQPDAPEGQTVLSVAEDHLVAQGHDGEPLMTPEGELAPKVAAAGRYLQHCHHNRRETLAATRQLAEAKVLMPWPLKVKVNADDATVTLSGLYCVSDKHLNQISADAYAALQGPAMALAHAQLFSMANVDQLSRRAAFLAQHEAGEAPENLDTLFGQADDDIEFDFDQ